MLLGERLPCLVCCLPYLYWSSSPARVFKLKAITRPESTGRMPSIRTIRPIGITRPTGTTLRIPIILPTGTTTFIPTAMDNRLPVATDRLAACRNLYRRDILGVRPDINSVWFTIPTPRAVSEHLI